MTLETTPRERRNEMTANEKNLAGAFFEDVACDIMYRDEAGRWTERTIRIEELHRSHVLAKCELRGNDYRRFNLNRVRRVRRVRPPVV